MPFYCRFYLVSFLINPRFPAQTTPLMNPFMTSFYPDPSIVWVKTAYYLINSICSYFPGILIFPGNDLKNWQQIGNVIDRLEQIYFKDGRVT